MRNKKRAVLRALSLCLALVLVATCALAAFPASAATVSDWQEKYDELEEKNKQLQQQIDANKNNANKQKEYIADLNEQINVLQQKVDLCAKQLSELDTQLAQMNAEYDEKYELFKQRVRANYMAPKQSLLSILLTSGSISEFLSSSEYFLRITKSDKELITSLTEQLTEIEQRKTEVEGTRDQLASEQASLNTKKTESQNIISQLNSSNSQLASEKEQVAKEMAAAANEIQRLINESQSSGSYVGGPLIWPLPGHSYISSYYNEDRNIAGVQDVHTGIDIPASTGTPIVAANSGVVKYVRYNTTGYGYHLLIDHGDGYYTLYAHTSKILVSAGQTVTKGQTIALVGATGRVTGPHLHFEVYVNKVRTNPLNYVKYS